MREPERSVGDLNEMKMIVCAGVVALAALGLLATVPAAQARDMMESSASAQMASIDVVRIKKALHLTPAQEPYWAPVEAALRELARRQARDANEGLVRRISQRVVQIALSRWPADRLAAAARPLESRGRVHTTRR